MQTLATDHTTVRAGEEYKAGSNFTRLRRTSLGRCELFLGLFRHGARDQRRPDRPGADSVDPDAIAHLLVCQAVGEGNNSWGLSLVKTLQYRRRQLASFRRRVV